MSRGIRNNNPGNVRISDIPWRGKLTPSPDPAFETFDTAHNGIRAIAKILLTYFKRDGLKTISEIVSKWAPPSENDTGAYANHVSKETGYGVNEDLIPDADTLSDLAYAIIVHENGSCPYSDDEIGAAVDDALGVVAQEEPATHNID